MSQLELSCNLCPQECFLCNEPLALLRNDSLCTKTHGWYWLDESSGRGTIAISGRSTVEADPVMKVNVERAPSRGGEEWASPRKQWTQSSEGGRGAGGSGWGQLFLINCFHVIDWLLMWRLAGRGASSRHWLNVLETSWWSSRSLHQHWDTYGWAWERAASYIPLFSCLSFLSPFLSFSFSALSENKLLPRFFHISPVYVFNCVNRRRWLVLEFLLSSHSVLHPPFSNTRAAWTKTFR